MKEKLRILHTPANIASQMTIFAKAQRELVFLIFVLPFELGIKFKQEGFLSTLKATWGKK